MGTLETDVKPGNMNFKHVVLAVLLSTLALTYGSTINEDDCEECVTEQIKAFTDCETAQDPEQCDINAMNRICAQDKCSGCPTCKPPNFEKEEDKCEECKAEQKQAFVDCKDADEPKECVEEKIKDICSKEDYKTCPTCSKPEGECKKCAEAQKEAVKKCKKDEDWDKECAAKAIKEVCDSNPDWMKCPTCKKPEDTCKRCAVAEKNAIAECKTKDDPKGCAINAIKTICRFHEECKDCKTCSKPKDWCPLCAKGAEIAKKKCGEDEDCYEEKIKMICSKKPCMECEKTCPQKELEKDWCPACKKAVDWGMKKCKKAKYPKKCAIKTWRGICWKDECKGCCRNLSLN